jgi:glycosyltransferase involved in cell wall biosynthesis
VLLSVIVHGYNNQDVVDRQLALWATWPNYDDIEFILIDDGSSPPLHWKNPPNRSRRARIFDDIPWNQPGARNLGASLASGETLLFFDLDHFIDAPAFGKILEHSKSINSQEIYRFRRIDPSGKLLHSHLNSFMIKRSAFFSICGYDEDFAGSYGYDDVSFYDRWLDKENTVTVLDSITLRVEEGYATRSLNRNWSRNRRLRKQKLRELKFKKSRLGGLTDYYAPGICNFLRFAGVFPKKCSLSTLRFNWGEDMT